MERRWNIVGGDGMTVFMRRDPHTIGAAAFKEKRRPDWPHHGL